jgi:hypothetical protein
MLEEHGVTLMESDANEIQRIVLAQPTNHSSEEQPLEDRVLLPRELTAENGAKYLLNGEFFETHIDSFSLTDEDIESKVPVQWSTIKEIYAKIVEHYANKIENPLHVSEKPFTSDDWERIAKDFKENAHKIEINDVVLVNPKPEFLEMIKENEDSLTDDFYCKEYDKVGFYCEEQCEVCEKTNHFEVVQPQPIKQLEELRDEAKSEIKNSKGEWVEHGYYFADREELSKFEEAVRAESKRVNNHEKATLFLRRLQINHSFRFKTQKFDGSILELLREFEKPLLNFNPKT